MIKFSKKTDFILCSLSVIFICGISGFFIKIPPVNGCSMQLEELKRQNEGLTTTLQRFCVDHYDDEYCEYSFRPVLSFEDKEKKDIKPPLKKEKVVAVVPIGKKDLVHPIK